MQLLSKLPLLHLPDVVAVSTPGLKASFGVTVAGISNIEGMTRRSMDACVGKNRLVSLFSIKY